jgi:hypothetical protein
MKLGRTAYCSRSCGAKANIETTISKEKRTHAHLKPDNKLDELSPFRWHLRNAKRRTKENGKEFSLTLDFLKELWEGQDGKCPYTGWQMKNLESSSPNKQLDLTPDRASLDRIDSSKGYVIGNVQFVCYMAQCCKSMFSSKQMIEFCEAVVAA